MTRPGSLLDDALALAARADVLLVATDLDGALAEFTLDPADTVPAPGGMDALRALAALPDTHVAVVSGRDVDTLSRLTGVEVDNGSDPIVLIGSHGAQSSKPEVTSDDALDDTQLCTLHELLTEVEALLGRHQGARLERKRAAVAVHTRGLADADAEAALAEAEQLATDRPGVRLLRGKSVVELSVSHADKGTAILALGGLLGATATFYAGDDVTDEDAFRALDPSSGDVTLKVGAGQTAAAHRVGQVTDLVDTLAQLSRLRAAAVSAAGGSPD